METEHGSPTAVAVELDIFSGMPNPAWTIGGAAAKRLLDSIEALPRTTPRTLASNLGYRGFVVRFTAGGEERLMRVQKGTVQTSTGEYFSDVGRELERYLLNSGKATLSSDIFALVASELPE